MPPNGRSRSGGDSWFCVSPQRSVRGQVNPRSVPLPATERWIRFIVLNNGTDRQPTLLLSLYTLIVASPQERQWIRMVWERGARLDR